MKIHLEIYLPFRGRRFWKGDEEVPAGVSPMALLRHLGLDHYPELSVIVNGRYHSQNEPVLGGSEVAILRASEGG